MTKNNNKILWWKCDVNLKDYYNTKKAYIRSWPNEGVYAKKFEKKITSLLKVRYAITCSNGTSAIYLAVKSLGIGPGDEVLVPNITFPATANAVLMTGARVVLVDINSHEPSLNIEDLNKKITTRTKAVIVVHISGRSANIDEIVKFTKKNKIFLIEDAAEGLFSKHKNLFLGSFGDFGCYSLSPNKIITSGQGGIVIMKKKKYFKKIKMLKEQGRSGNITGGDDRHYSFGFNFKYTDIQALVSLSQLKQVNKRIKQLKKNYIIYKKYLINNNNFKLLKFNKENVPLWIDCYALNRNKLIDYLRMHKIATRNYWFPLNTQRPYYKSFKTFPNSRFFNKKLFWLPSNFNITVQQIKKVCQLVNNFYKN